jgi:hypothetical protein
MGHLESPFRPKRKSRPSTAKPKPKLQNPNPNPQPSWWCLMADIPEGGGRRLGGDVRRLRQIRDRPPRFQIVLPGYDGSATGAGDCHLLCSTSHPCHKSNNAPPSVLMNPPFGCSPLILRLALRLLFILFHFCHIWFQSLPFCFKIVSSV